MEQNELTKNDIYIYIVQWCGHKFKRRLGAKGKTLFSLLLCLSGVTVQSETSNETSEALVGSCSSCANSKWQSSNFVRKLPLILNFERQATHCSCPVTLHLEAKLFHLLLETHYHCACLLTCCCFSHMPSLSVRRCRSS